MLIYYYYLCDAKQVMQNQRRYLNLLEYQSKTLLQESGVAIQEFCVLNGTNAINMKNLQNFRMYQFQYGKILVGLFKVFMWK